MTTVYNSFLSLERYYRIIFAFFLIVFLSENILGQNSQHGGWTRFPTNSEIEIALQNLLNSLPSSIEDPNPLNNNIYRITKSSTPIIKFHNSGSVANAKERGGYYSEAIQFYISDAVVYINNKTDYYATGRLVYECRLLHNHTNDRFEFYYQGVSGNISATAHYNNKRNEIKNSSGVDFGFAPNISSSNNKPNTANQQEHNNDDHSTLWTVIIGAVTAAGLLAIRKRIKKKKKTASKDNKKKPKEEKEIAEYILQLNKEEFSLKPNDPETLTAKVWKITEKGKSITDATIKIHSPEKALKMMPYSVVGSLNSQLSLKDKPKENQFYITITASVDGHSYQKQVLIRTGIQNRIIIETAPDGTSSLRPNIDQNLTCFAQVVDADDKDIPELTKKIKFDNSNEPWVDLLKDGPYYDEGWAAILVGASDPDGEYDISHPPKTVNLDIYVDYEEENKEIHLENDLKINLLDCKLETDLEHVTFPATKEQSEITFKANIEDCDGSKPWKFKAVYMKDYETVDDKPLTNIDIQDVKDTEVKITLTGPILFPKEGEQFVRKLFVVTAQQEEEKALERHIYVMVSMEGLFIEKGVEKNNVINVSAKGAIKKDMEFSLNVYNKETDQIEPNAEGLKNLNFELICEDKISKNIDQVLQTDLLFESIFNSNKNASYKLDIPFMLPGTGEDIYELDYKISAIDLDVENEEDFQQIIKLRVETYGIGRQYPEWRKAYDDCLHDINYYVRDIEKREKFRHLLKTKGKELDVYGLVELNRLIIRIASEAIIAEGKEWNDYADFLDKVLYVLDYVEYAGDIAFQVLVSTFTGGMGGIAASAIKQTFITGARIVIQGESIDEFYAKLWKDTEAMLYSTVKGRIVNTQTIEKYYKGSKYKVWAMYAVITFAIQFKRLGSIPEAAKATARQLRDEVLIRYLHGKVRQEQAMLKAKAAEKKELAAKEELSGSNGKKLTKGRNDYESAKTPPDVSGYTKRSMVAIQKIANKLKVQIITRPTNAAAKLLLRKGLAVPKKQFVKNKTINDLDTYLGASKKNIGKVGTFEPKFNKAKMKNLTKAQIDAVKSRYKQRRREWVNQSDHIKASIKKGEIFVKNGLILDGKTGKPFTGDIDVFDIRGPHGEKISRAKYKKVVEELIKSNVTNVEHGAHLWWQRWKGGSVKDIRTQEGISDTITKGHSKGGEDSTVKENLVSFRGSSNINAKPKGIFYKGRTDVKNL